MLNGLEIKKDSETLGKRAYSISRLKFDYKNRILDCLLLCPTVFICWQITSEYKQRKIKKWKRQITVYQPLVKERTNCFQKAKLDGTAQAFFLFFHKKWNVRNQWRNHNSNWMKRNEISLVDYKETHNYLAWKNYFEILWTSRYTNWSKYYLAARCAVYWDKDRI